MLIFRKKFVQFFKVIVIFTVILFPISYIYASFSCSITTQALCGSGVVMLRMSGSTNAHAELPSQSTPNYDNNVVCCTGVMGLSNSCSETNKVTIGRLSGVTNAHVERNTEVNANYTQDACLSSIYTGDQITLAYQASNCNDYDTTLFSMEKTPTNSMVGGPGAYNNKVCAKILSQSISFNLSHNNVGFGNLIPTAVRYATNDGLGSSSEVESYNISVNTNAPAGYGLYVSGDSPKKGSTAITPIGNTNTPPSAGSNAFGIRAVATGGNGGVVTPYDGAGFAYDGNITTPTTIAAAPTSNGVTTNYSIRTVATIDSFLEAGSYSTNLTYFVTANF